MIFDFNHGWDLPHTYTAPDGAVAANVTFRLATLSGDHLPKVFIDDVEFVDVTPGLTQTRTPGSNKSQTL